MQYTCSNLFYHFMQSCSLLVHWNFVCILLYTFGWWKRLLEFGGVYAGCYKKISVWLYLHFLWMHQIWYSYEKLMQFVGSVNTSARETILCRDISKCHDVHDVRRFTSPTNFILVTHHNIIVVFGEKIYIWLSSRHS